MDPEQNKKCEIIIITIIITITIIIIIYYIQADDFIDWHGSCCQLCNHAFPVSVVLWDRSRRAELSWAELEQQKRSRLSRADVAETASVLYIHTHTYIYLNIYIHIYKGKLALQVQWRLVCVVPRPSYNNKPVICLRIDCYAGPAWLLWCVKGAPPLSHGEHSCYPV